MHKHSALDALLPAVRQDVLAAALMQPERWWYLSDLAAHVGRGPSSLQRELASLTAAGILESRPDGNRVYYRANADCPFFPELKGLITKTRGVVETLRETLAPLASRIEWAFVYGSVARGDESGDSDIDVMLIGSLKLVDAAVRLKQAEELVGRPISPSLYPLREFAKKLQVGHHFVRTVATGPKLFFLGDPREFAQAFAEPKASTARDKPQRTGRAPGGGRT